MPRHRSSRPPPPPHAHHAARARHSASGLRGLVRIDDVVELLQPWIPDVEDREFVARCIATEGPMHHRVASVALLRLIARALDATGGPPAEVETEGAPVPFRLPPHLDRHGDDEAQYPIRLPRRALSLLAASGSTEADAYADALADGPAHHALANAVMVCMLDALIERLSSKGAA